MINVQRICLGLPFNLQWSLEIPVANLSWLRNTLKDMMKIFFPADNDLSFLLVPLLFFCVFIDTN